MNIGNIMLIFVVLVTAIAAIVYMVKKNQNQVIEDAIEVDDKTFTLDKMVKFVKQRLDEITKINLYDIGLSEEELKRRRAKKYELKKALKGCTFFLKMHIMLSIYFFRHKINHCIQTSKKVPYQLSFSKYGTS